MKSLIFWIVKSWGIYKVIQSSKFIANYYNIIRLSLVRAGRTTKLFTAKFNRQK